MASSPLTRRWVVYESAETGTVEVYVREFQGRETGGKSLAEVRHQKEHQGLSFGIDSLFTAAIQ